MPRTATSTPRPTLHVPLSVSRSEQLIAFATHGYFNPTPAFHGRVERAGDAGLLVHGLTSSANGVYSVEINAKGDLTLRHNATVEVVGKHC